MALAVIALRFVQFAGAALLFGAPLFFLWIPGLKSAPWQRRLLVLAAQVLAIAAPLNFLAQTAQVAGSVAAIRLTKVMPSAENFRSRDARSGGAAPRSKRQKTASAPSQPATARL